MTSLRTHLLRSALVGSVAAAAVITAAVPASAAPTEEPGAVTLQSFRTDFFSGAPFPFGFAVLDAATDGTGTVRLDAGDLCNSVTSTCTEFSAPLSVQWINFATGAAGAARVGDAPVTVTTGRGPVGISVTAAYSAGLPSFGIINP
ncbi:MAG: hypothetical protein ACOH2Q_21155 [Rhodococcus sp. (in: high G+C Gram-positive bacteria)]